MADCFQTIAYSEILFFFSLQSVSSQVSVHLNEQTEEVKLAKHVGQQKHGTGMSIATEDVQQTSTVEINKGTHSFRLEELAFARSGDKGNHCNIGNQFWLPNFLFLPCC